MDTTAGRRGWIAVVTQWRKGYARLPVPYTHALEVAGGTTRVLSTFGLPPGEEDVGAADVELDVDPDDASGLEGACGLLLPGGGDIDPLWYGSPRHPRTHNVSHRRDRFELTLLGEALTRDMPVLAICHGMQLLNVHMGGTLDQHLADDPSRLDHDRDRPRAEPVHRLRVEPTGILADVLGPAADVNSHHHQGLGEVAEGLIEVAWAEDDVLEAVVTRDHSWVLGVQWHPEAMASVDETQRRIFEAFVDAARKYAHAADRHARTA